MKNENNNYDIRCTRCGRPVEDLTPYDLNGEIKLIRKFREVDLVKRVSEYDEILQNFAAGSKITDLNKTYGESKVQSAFEYDQYFGNLADSWECKDCINDDGPFKRHSQCNY